MYEEKVESALLDFHGSRESMYGEVSLDYFRSPAI
jgi:hypothetical protein